MNKSYFVEGPYSEVKIIFDNSHVMRDERDVRVDTVYIKKEEDLQKINKLFSQMKLANKSINTKLVMKGYYVELRSTSGESCLIDVSYLKYGGVIFSTFGSENYYNDDLNEYFFQKITNEGGQPNW